MKDAGCLGSSTCNELIDSYNTAIAAGNLTAAEGLLIQINLENCITYPDKPICYYLEQTYYAAIAAGDNVLATNTYKQAQTDGCVFANPAPTPDLDNENPILFGKEYLYTWAEQHLYGSSRIGVEEPLLVWKHKEGISSGLYQNPFRVDKYIPIATSIGSPPSFLNVYYQLQLEGNKRYELSNHLGNVMSVITDRKRGAGVSAGNYTYYLPATVSASDYYAFGLEMRMFSAGAYRYGFNGKENDRGNFGLQLVQDYGMRLYNPALGKFLSVDPLSKEFPWYAPYQFAGNKPIWATDLDGAEETFATMMYEQRLEDYVQGKVTKEELERTQKAMSFGTIMGALITTELFVTKGKISQGLFYLGVSNTISSDHAADNARLLGNEERAQQLSAEARNGYSEALIAYGLGKVVGLTAGALGRFFVNSEKFALTTLQRATQLKDGINLPPIAKNNVVIAVANLVDKEGNVVRVISINEAFIKNKEVLKAIKSSIKQDEILITEAPFKGAHAEDAVYNYAKSKNLQVTTMDPSSKFCKRCYDNVIDRGINVQQGTTGKYSKNDLKRMQQK